MNNRNTRYITLCFQLLCVFAVQSIFHVMLTIFSNQIVDNVFQLFIAATYAFGVFLMMINIKKDYR